MKKIAFLLLIPVLSCTSNTEKSSSGYPIQPFEFTAVHLHDGFWKDWVTTTRNATIPFSFNKCEETGRVNNFIYAGGIKEGKYEGKFGFNDSDVYKIIEGAAYSLSLDEDPEMEAYLDTLIGYIAAAQEEDGYIYTPWTLKANEYNEFYCCTYSEEGKWKGTNGASHEFYNAGHMYEAAVAHYRATGKRSFLDVALKNADLIYQVCITEGNNYVPGHQEIEIGLIKLYDVTEDEKYLELAKHLLDIRANQSSGAYSQAHLPVTEQTEAVGHAVRANYMYTAMADIAALSNDSAYLEAIDQLWKNVVTKKLSITGGVGASHEGEAYGGNYDLPNHPYNETCASIANVYWNYRMFLLHGDSKYYDVIERTLYNGLLSGLSLDGTLFFYPNTLEHDGHRQFNRGVNGRSPWFDCSCCPTNLSRFIPSVAGYAYAVKDHNVYVNLYMNNAAELKVGSESFSFTQETDYPWNGNITLTINEAPLKETSLNIRIPGWLNGSPVPSDLFKYIDPEKGNLFISINGDKVAPDIINGYASLERTWKPGDQIDITFEMTPRLVEAHPMVQAKKGLAAVEYGPIVYCAEEIDNQEVEMEEIKLNASTKFDAQFRPDLLGGVNMLTSENLHLIPYYSWANREIGPMKVWMPFE